MRARIAHFSVVVGKIIQILGCGRGDGCFYRIEARIVYGTRRKAEIEIRIILRVIFEVFKGYLKCVLPHDVGKDSVNLERHPKLEPTPQDARYLFSGRRFSRLSLDERSHSDDLFQRLAEIVHAFLERLYALRKVFLHYLDDSLLRQGNGGK